jgi:hypothetical protein
MTVIDNAEPVIDNARVRDAMDHYRMRAWGRAATGTARPAPPRRRTPRLPLTRWRPSFGKRLQTIIDCTILDPQTMTIRRQQVRQAAARHRKRRKVGLLWRPILITKSQLDQLEQRYLDPGRRGDPLDECDAIAMFLTDALPRNPDRSEHRLVGPCINS